MHQQVRQDSRALDKGLAPELCNNHQIIRKERVELKSGFHHE